MRLARALYFSLPLPLSQSHGAMDRWGRQCAVATEAIWGLREDPISECPQMKGMEATTFIPFIFVGRVEVP